MIIIGLCGNSGSGKSTVCEYFSKYGITSINADLVYRDLTTPGSELNKKISMHFGNDVLNEDLSLNRKVLAEIVFSDTTGENRLLLNKITHSAVIEETLSRIELLRAKGERAVIFDAPLLFESGFDKKCDVIIALTADREIKIERIMRRDNIDYEKASLRINAQIEEKFLVEHADYVIDTTDDSDIEFRIKQITEIILKCEV